MLLLFCDIIDSPSEKDLFKKLYKEYSRLMMKIAFDIVHDRELAEDAVQEAFLKIARNMKYFSDICPQSRNLAVIIVRNAAIDIYNTRKKIASGEVFTDDISENRLVQDSVNVEDIALGSYEAEQIKDAIKSLKPIYRDAITLRYLNEMSYREIASILNISEDTAKKHVRRALEKLREQLL